MNGRAVIIGSGVAGLTAGILLGQAGYRVTVVEQHSVAGGLMQTYRRGGLRFPTGVHILGSMGANAPLRRYLACLGVLDRLRLTPMRPSGFMRLAFPGVGFTVPLDEAGLRSSLRERFPGEYGKASRFLDRMNSCVQRFPLYAFSRAAEDHVDEALLEPLDTLFDREGMSCELRAVLSGLNPLLGLGPAACPCYAYFLLLHSFLHGCVQVDEERSSLAEAFTESLEAAGGVLLRGTRATRVITVGREAEAVVVDGQRRIPADVVLYTGHPKGMLVLCDDAAFRPAFADRLRTAPETRGLLVVNLRWPKATCPCIGQNHILYGSLDTNSPYSQTLDSRAEELCVYCSSGVETDGHLGVSALAFTPLSAWSAWESTRTGRRTADYEEAKWAAARQVLARLRGQWGSVLDGVAAVDVATPLTQRDYLAAPVGSAYGLARSSAALRQTRLSPRTRVRNLFLAGQSVVLPGVLGTVISSVAACGAILGREALMRRILETEGMP